MPQPIQWARKTKETTSVWKKRRVRLNTQWHMYLHTNELRHAPIQIHTHTHTHTFTSTHNLSSPEEGNKIHVQLPVDLLVAKEIQCKQKHRERFWVKFWTDNNIAPFVGCEEECCSSSTEWIKTTGDQSSWASCCTCYFVLEFTSVLEVLPCW